MARLVHPVVELMVSPFNSSRYIFRSHKQGHLVTLNQSF